jgi:hypothetical protein
MDVAAFDCQGGITMNLFLAIAAVLAWLIGGVMLLFPEQFFAPNGLTMTPMMATVAQVQAQAHGATLVGLGVIDWLARGADHRKAASRLEARPNYRRHFFLVAPQQIP